jgi:ABC-type dipeptide/oligopeptide/nickel transport system permease component
MLRFVLREAGRLALGLLGALLMAAAMGALAAPHAGSSITAFLAAWGKAVVGFVRLDFGHSAISGASVPAELGAHLPLTMGLVAEGFVVALLVGVPVGFLLGTGPARRAASPFVQLVSAAPTFVAALALAYAAFRGLGWAVPIGAGVKSGLVLWPHNRTEIQAALLPVLTVGLAGAGAAQLALRRVASQTAREPWRAELRRMGLTALDVERAYVIPAVLAGLLACLGEVVLALLSAAAVTEWVFNYAGAADLFVKSVALRDWSIAAAILFVFAGLTMTAHFVGVSISRAVADPGTRQ